VGGEDPGERLTVPVLLVGPTRQKGGELGFPVGPRREDVSQVAHRVTLDVVHVPKTAQAGRVEWTSSEHLEIDIGGLEAGRSLDQRRRTRPHTGSSELRWALDDVALKYLVVTRRPASGCLPVRRRQPRQELAVLRRGTDRLLLGRPSEGWAPVSISRWARRPGAIGRGGKSAVGSGGWGVSTKPLRPGAELGSCPVTSRALGSDFPHCRAGEYLASDVPGLRIAPLMARAAMATSSVLSGAAARCQAPLVPQERCRSIPSPKQVAQRTLDPLSRPIGHSP